MRSLPGGLHPDRDLLVDRVVVVEVVVLAVELDLADRNPLDRRASPDVVPFCINLDAGEFCGGLGYIRPQVLHGGGEELR